MLHVHFLKYLKNAVSWRLETFWQFKCLNFEYKKVFFQPPRPALSYHSNVLSWRPILNSTFQQLSCKSSAELEVFCYFHDECRKCSHLSKFGFDIPLVCVLVTIFVSHPFSCFTDLKLDNTITLAPWMVSFYMVFHKLLDKVSLVTRGRRFLVFE